MAKHVAALRRVVHLRVPQSDYGLVSELCTEGQILACDYQDNDVLLTMEIPAQIEYKVKAYLQG
jgi:GTP-binding protein HflX